MTPCGVVFFFFFNKKKSIQGKPHGTLFDYLCKTKLNIKNQELWQNTF